MRKDALADIWSVYVRISFCLHIGKILEDVSQKGGLRPGYGAKCGQNHVHSAVEGDADIAFWLTLNLKAKIITALSYSKLADSHQITLQRALESMMSAVPVDAPLIGVDLLKAVFIPHDVHRHVAGSQSNENQIRVPGPCILLANEENTKRHRIEHAPDVKFSRARLNCRC